MNSIETDDCSAEIINDRVYIAVRRNGRKRGKWLTLSLDFKKNEALVSLAPTVKSKKFASAWVTGASKSHNKRVSAVGGDF